MGRRMFGVVRNSVYSRVGVNISGLTRILPLVNSGRTRRMFPPSNLVPWQRCRLWTEPAGLLRAPQNEKAKQDKYEHNYDCVRILLSRATARLGSAPESL